MGTNENKPYEPDPLIISHDFRINGMTSANEIFALSPIVRRRCPSFPIVGLEKRTVTNLVEIFNRLLPNSKVQHKSLPLVPGR
jgi:hypothetical protein